MKLRVTIGMVAAVFLLSGSVSCTDDNGNSETDAKDISVGDLDAKEDGVLVDVEWDVDDAEPETTPDTEPDLVPDEGTPDVVPDTVPDEATPDADPDATPDVSDEGTPDADPDATPDADPDTTPDATPDADPDVAPDADPDVAPDATPDVTPDAGPDTTTDVTPDVSGGCDPNGPQCNNCIDDDGDGFTDGFDVECISPDDNDEFSFATGIPGDNKNNSGVFDCFFDGDSGGGNDGCEIAEQCIVGGGTCGDGICDIGDPNTCSEDCGVDNLTCYPTQECVDNCAPMAGPGCDCFGCCTICKPGGPCYDVVVHPALAPDCNEDVVDNPELCPPCTFNTDCGTPCDNSNCELCPGQTEADLPPECSGSAVCPEDLVPCNDNSDGNMCPSGTYCNTGCCVPFSISPG